MLYILRDNSGTHQIHPANRELIQEIENMFQDRNPDDHMIR